MPLSPVNFVGSPGVVRDLQAHLLPASAWSHIQNARMNNASAHKFPGYKEIYDPPTVAPYRAWYMPTPGQNWWVYCGLARVYATDGTTHYNITRQVAAPGAPSGVKTVGTELEEGDYQYKITFVNAQGETEAGTASAVITTTAGSLQIDLSSIPTSTEDTVTARKIYRTEVGPGATYKLVDTISDNSTTTYNDAVPDASLGAAAPAANTADWLYAADADLNWTGGPLSGILILNNGIDLPQQWVPGSSNRCQNLANWPATDTARVVRVFLNTIVALDLTKSGTRFPYLIKTSHPASPGAVPTSYDETDPTKDITETDKAETSDYLIDGLAMRDFFIIYKEKSAILMQFVGGSFIFRFSGLSRLDGMFTRNCAVEFRPGMHAVLTHNDFVVHNGVTSESKIDGKNRKWLFDTIDSTLYARTFLAHNERHNEVWICFPAVGATAGCNTALVWNYREDSWSERQLPEASFISSGVIFDVSDDTWDNGLAVSWDSSDGIERWDQDRASPTSNRLLMTVPGDTKLYWLDVGATENGTAYTTVLERTHLNLVPLRDEDDLSMSFTLYKFVRGIWPRVTAIAASIDFYIGTHEHVRSDPVWYGPFTFNPATEFKIDLSSQLGCGLAGRLFAIRVEISANELVEIDGFDFDGEVLSQF